ncbi:MAG TPA: acetyl-CoA carboxylase biotin carboxyl carrier protein [Elusimicrobiota bacterium]|nr:acetyl-CoA carboxylase biotin carboxyl carrier protein [Elusimicrobiota bacterium]
MTDVKPNGKKKALEAQELQYYYDLMIAEDLLELEVREKDFYLRLSRGRPASPAAAPAVVPSAPAAAAAASAADNVPPEQNQFHSIASPLAGVFYRSPSPQSGPFVKEGDKVALNQVLCIVEAMKVMNEIRADRPSVIRKILVENGKPVAAGQNLFLVDPLP